MKRIAYLLAGAALPCSAVPAFAQDVPAESAAPAEPDGQFDIVVTAQKRSERGQDVPISLTVLSGSQLERASINNVQDLQRVVPSFTIYKQPQAAGTRLSIRGIGSSANSAIEPSVGAFVDGIYVPRPGALLASLNDIASVEVLRGPQGTLFGRNASVGVLSFHTTEPQDELGGTATISAGSFGRIIGSAILNMPVSDRVSTRFSLLWDRTDGYGHDMVRDRSFGGNDTLSFRGTVRAELGDNLTWLVRGDYQRQDGDGQAVTTVDDRTVTPTAAANFAQRLNGLQPRLDNGFSRSVRQYTSGDYADNQWGVSSDLSLNLGDYTLRLLSGYRDWKNLQSERDITFTLADIFGRNAGFRSKAHSEELQLISPDTLLDGKLKFVAGLYYFHEDYEISSGTNLGAGYCNILIRNTLPALLAPCLAGPQRGAAYNIFDQETSSYAGYGQATVNITSNWDFTLGARYSHDDKTASFLSEVYNQAASILTAPDNANLRFSGGKATYRIGTTWKPDRDILLFATWSTGYKSGGFDSGAGTTLGANRLFRPETTTNYELGAKTQWLDRRLTANATLFRMDIDDFQLRSYNGTFFQVRNAGSIRQQGVEFELSGRPTDTLTLGVSGTRLASKYTDFRGAPGLPGFGGVQDLTGQRTTYSPKWQGLVSADWRDAISSSGWELGLSGRASFTSEIDVGSGDANPQGFQSGYTLVGARISLFSPSERWEFAVSGENLTDKRYCNGKYPQTFAGLLGVTDRSTGGAVQRCVLGEPRSIRATAKFKF